MFDTYFLVCSRYQKDTVPMAGAWAEIGNASVASDSNSRPNYRIFPDFYIESDEAIKPAVETWWQQACKSKIITSLSKDIYYIKMAQSAVIHKGHFIPQSIVVSSTSHYTRIYFDFIDEKTGKVLDLSQSTYITDGAAVHHMVGMDANLTDPNLYVFIGGSDRAEKTLKEPTYLYKVSAQFDSNKKFAHNDKMWKANEAAKTLFFNTVKSTEIGKAGDIFWNNSSEGGSLYEKVLAVTRILYDGAHRLVMSGYSDYYSFSYLSHIRPVCAALNWVKSRTNGGYAQYKLSKDDISKGTWLDGTSFSATNYYFDFGSVAKKPNESTITNFTALPPENAKIHFLDSIEYFEDTTPPEPPKPEYGKLVFTLTLTGMGNDPCKQCCSCEIEDKKYETVIEFTSDEALQDKVTIDPTDLEHSWAGNTLTVMLAEGETVTVDNIPAGVKYKITVNSDDPCDENEYNVDNGDGSNEGTIGEDAEGNPQEETEVQIEAQRGETLDEYLERLRQKGYEALAENLKLENVEFTLQDERIKLGDLVTVDMPEFDFKAVVRVTGVKLKSQDNQTIRTISVGTPLKILRKARI